MSAPAAILPGMAEHEAIIVRRFTVQGREVAVTRHAALRYRERVRPSAFNAKEAAEDLERIALACGRIRKNPPAWHNAPASEHRTDAYLMLGDDIAIPLVEDRALSCITRGTWGDVGRERRSKGRAARKQRNKATREQRSRKDLTSGQYRRRMLRQRRESDKDAQAS